MSAPLTSTQQTEIARAALKLCTLWQLTRTDGLILRFTDHDRVITYNGNLFQPAGGWSSSARQNKYMDAKNVQITGILSSPAITETDLTNGLYRGAQVLEMLVDWSKPFNGPYLTRSYYIISTIYSPEQWQAQISGLPVLLQQNQGQLYSRVCRHTFGLGICGQGLNMADWTSTYTSLHAVDATYPKRIFQIPMLSTTNDPKLSNASVTFTSGQNAGVTAETKSYTNLGTGYGQFEFQLDLPYPMALTDHITLVEGCDHQFSTCGLYNNQINFGGFPYIPGTNRAMQMVTQ